MDEILDEHRNGVGELNPGGLTSPDHTPFDANTLYLLPEQHALDLEVSKDHLSPVKDP